MRLLTCALLLLCPLWLQGQLVWQACASWCNASHASALVRSLKPLRNTEAGLCLQALSARQEAAAASMLLLCVQYGACMQITRCTCACRVASKPSKSGWWGGSSRTTSSENEVAPSPSSSSFSRTPLQSALSEPHVCNPALKAASGTFATVRLAAAAKVWRQSPV